MNYIINGNKYFKIEVHRGWGKGGMKTYYLMVIEFLFGVKNKFKLRISGNGCSKP